MAALRSDPSSRAADRTAPAEAMATTPGAHCAIDTDRALRLYSRKYDGSLHYTFDGRVVAASTEQVMLFIPAGTPLRSYRGRWNSRMHMLCIYWADRYYNLCVSWYPDWRPRAHYVNIATPATWTSVGLHVIDLDLDLIRRTDADRILLDDADEFERHRRLWGYPPELVAACRAATAEVRRLMAACRFPFDRTIHQWATGVALREPGV